jgi:hypothetical protein
MDRSAAVLGDAYQLLRQELYGYLDEAEALATERPEWTPEETVSARALVSDLTGLVRAILLDHKETATGICPTCNSRWPCVTVCTIHRLIKDPVNEFVKIAQRSAER